MTLDGLDVLQRMLEVDLEQRISSYDATTHAWFAQVKYKKFGEEDDEPSAPVMKTTR